MIVVPEADRQRGGSTALPLRDTLSQLRLRELLVEVQDRVEQIVRGRDRLDGLVEAMLVVNPGLDLDTTLRTIVRTATSLVDARYGALGVRGATGTGLSSSSRRESTTRSASGSALHPRDAVCSAFSWTTRSRSVSTTSGGTRPRSGSRPIIRRCALSSASRYASATRSTATFI